MRSLAFRGKLVLGVSAALMVLVVVGLLSYQRILEQDADAAWVEHTHRVIATLDELQTDLLDAETGQRGFLLTGEPSYLQPYTRALERMSSDFQLARQLTADNPSRQRELARMSSLIASKLAELEATIALRKSEGLISSATVVRTDAGKQYMDEIRALVAQMKLEEERLLQQRLKSSASASRETRLVIFGGNLLGFLFLVAAGFIIRREMAKREQIERDLRASETRYRSFFENNPQPVWEYDLESLAILDVNRSAVRHYGYSREEFLSMTVADIRPAEDLPALLENVRATQQEPEQRGIWRHRKKDGSIIDVEVTSHSLPYRQPPARLVVSTDITERKKVEETLKGLLESAPDAMVIVNGDGRIVRVNWQAESVFGYQRTELLGEPVEKLIPQRYGKLHAHQRASYFANPKTRLMGTGMELYGRRKDGTEFPVEVSLSPLETSEGTLVSSAIRDISDRKRLEAEMKIRNAQLEAANKELEAFSYSVSHDLRAPLRGIDGFGQALLEDQADRLDEEGKAYLKRIRAATLRMGDLIDDLLSLSRVTRAELSRKPTDLSEMALSIAAEFRRQQPERDVEFVVAPGLLVNADPRLMRVVLENLLGNSWKFTSKRERARIEFGRTEQNGSSAFFVRDNGAGFDPAYSGRLFGAFHRLHGTSEFPGTGIGLATVQRIVHRHGGKVWGEGAVDRGATFYFQL